MLGCTNSTHKIQKQKHVFLFRRFCWLAVVLFSMGSFTYYSFNTYTRWKDYPVILGFDEQMTDISEISFPAVRTGSYLRKISRVFKFLFK